MTALETFTTASKQPLTTGRRPDMTAVCAKRTLSETPRYSSRFGSKPVQPDRVLTLMRANTDENTYVLNTRAKSRPGWWLLPSNAAHIRRSLFCARTLRAAIPLWFRITPNAARKNANWRKRPASSRGRQTGSSALPLFPQAGMCADRNTKEIQTARLCSEKQNIFLTSLAVRHILKACSNVAEASATRWTKMLIDRRKVVVANGNLPHLSFRLL